MLKIEEDYWNMDSFDQTKAFNALKKCANSPPNLKEILTPERIKKMTLKNKDLSISLSYACERVDKKILDQLYLLAEEMHVEEKMKKLQAMEVINYVRNCLGENRRVGHTAIRKRIDPHDTEHVKEAAASYQKELKKLSQFIPSVDHYKHIVVIGIGGSYLGTDALYNALKSFQKNKKTLYFASNIDPDKTAGIINEIDIKETLVITVSKSGSTLEIKSTEALFRKRFKEAKIDPKERFVVVTSQNSPMDTPDKYAKSFYMWDHIGGRYSVSSTVGAVPLSIIFGMEIWDQFLEGLRKVDHHVLTSKPKENIPLLGALLSVWNRNFLDIQTEAIIPYSSALKRWSAHLQQVFMESNGKHVRQSNGDFITHSTGALIWGEPGTESQHSFFQWIHQGTSEIALEFIGFKEMQHEGSLDAIINGTTNQEKLLSNLFAQMIALAKGDDTNDNNKQFSGNRPSRLLFADKLTPTVLGEMLAYYEHLVAYQGFLWDINSFDQEGVQLGKVCANEIIDLFKEKRERVEIEENTTTNLARAYLSELDIN